MVMDNDDLYATVIAGDAASISKLEMEVGRTNDRGKTILHIESVKGNTDHVRFIVRQFASKNLLLKLNNFNQSILQLAALYERTEVVEVLIDASRQHLPFSSFQAFLRQPSKSFEISINGAVAFGHVSIVKLLLKADPSDTHIPNDEGKTPIYLAAENGYTDIVKVICTTCTALTLEGPSGSTTALHALIKNTQQGMICVI